MLFSGVASLYSVLGFAVLGSTYVGQYRSSSTFFFGMGMFNGVWRSCVMVWYYQSNRVFILFSQQIYITYFVTVVTCGHENLITIKMLLTLLRDMQYSYMFVCPGHCNFVNLFTDKCNTYFSKVDMRHACMMSSNRLRFCCLYTYFYWFRRTWSGI